MNAALQPALKPAWRADPTMPAARWGGAARAWLPGARLHFQHGPIDLIIGADGEAGAVAAAHQSAWVRFTGVLEELVGELPALRAPVLRECPVNGPVARRMWQACRPFAARFITPMAAVAGAVAEEIVSHYRRAGIDRAWVNNGGDIALHLTCGHPVRVGLFADLGRLSGELGRLRLDGGLVVEPESPVRGIATSGWRGRSLSMGIADSVTVLAAGAAPADAAATMIANAVDVDHALIVRRPACELRPDTDLGSLPVVVDVPRLPDASVRAALAAGTDRASELLACGLIEAAVIVCQGRVSVVGRPGCGVAGLAGAVPALHNDSRATQESNDEWPDIEVTGK